MEIGFYKHHVVMLYTFPVFAMICELLLISLAQTSRWVTYEIVHRVQLKSRVSALEKLIKLAEELLKLNNFNGVMEILSGINSSPVRRLKKTWEGIGEHWQGRMKRLEELMSHDQNYKSYRAALHNCDPPTIPYLGMG